MTERGVLRGLILATLLATGGAAGQVTAVLNLDAIELRGTVGSEVVRVSAAVDRVERTGVVAVTPELTSASSLVTRLNVWVGGRAQEVPSGALRGLYNADLSSLSVVRLDGVIAVRLLGGDGASTYGVFIEFERGRATARRLVVDERVVRTPL